MVSDNESTFSRILSAYERTHPKRDKDDAPPMNASSRVKYGAREPCPHGLPWSTCRLCCSAYNRQWYRDKAKGVTRTQGERVKMVLAEMSGLQ